MKFLRAAFCAAVLALAGSADAQDWPSRPIRVLVGFGAGGGTDIIARMVAQPLTEILGQPVVIENKPGAGGSIAADAVAKAAPDGHTVFAMNSGHTASAAIYRSLPFDAVADFSPVGMIATMPLIVVAAPGFAGNSVADLIAQAKAAPGKINYGSVSVGSSQHLAGALLREMGGVDLVHVPYRDTPGAINALRGGEVQVLFEVVAPVLGQVRSGDLKALGITSAERFPVLPDLAPVAASGLQGYDVTTWYALALPAKAPQPIVAKFNAALRSALAREGLKAQLSAAAYLPSDGGTPEALGRHIAAEVARWRKTREAAGIPQQ
jgi:tripartite-type tricarboxylate transporter receptor subunit TctC